MGMLCEGSGQIRPSKCCERARTRLRCGRLLDQRACDLCALLRGPRCDEIRINHAPRRNLRGDGAENRPEKFIGERIERHSRRDLREKIGVLPHGSDELTPCPLQGTIRTAYGRARSGCGRLLCRIAAPQPAAQGVGNDPLVEKELRRRAAHVCSALHSIQLREDGQHRAQRRTLSLDAVRHLRADMAQVEGGCGHGRLDEGAERIRAVRAHVLIGILAVGQEEDAQLRRAPMYRRERAQGRLLSRAVAVVAEDDARRAAQEQCGVVARKRRAERRDDVVNARLPRGNRVHIALDDNGIARAGDRAVGTIHAEEELSLVKDRRLRRVEVLRLGIAERTSAKADDAPALIRDGDDDAPTKAVVDPVAALAPHGKPRIDEDVLRDAALAERIGEL